jgi:hypothetical protein
VTKGPRVIAIPFVLAALAMGGAAGTAEASPPSAALSPAALLPPPPPDSPARDNDPSYYGGNPIGGCIDGTLDLTLWTPSTRPEPHCVQRQWNGGSGPSPLTF